MATVPKLPLPEMKVVPAMVIIPGVVVVMVMLEPAAKLAGWYLVPVPSAARSCPVTVGAVEVAVPPLPTPNMPETSVEPKAMAPLKSNPALLLLTGRAVFKEAKVEEPLEATIR